MYGCGSFLITKHYSEMGQNDRGNGTEGETTWTVRNSSSFWKIPELTNKAFPHWKRMISSILTQRARPIYLMNRPVSIYSPVSTFFKRAFSCESTGPCRQGHWPWIDPRGYGKSNPCHARYHNLRSRDFVALKNLNRRKAASPDKIKPVVLQELREELAPILKILFERSLQNGSVPDDWTSANVRITIVQKRWQVLCCQLSTNLPYLCLV